MNKKLLLLLLFIGSLLTALCVGRYPIGFQGVLRLFLFKFGMAVTLPPPHEMQLIFWNIRVPRILMSFVVGGGICIAGTVFQALFRNPLASPDILGVTFGACFGAGISILYFSQTIFAMQGSSFFFGLVAVGLTYLLASRSWDQSAAVLVISGIVVSAVFQAGLWVLMYLANPYDQLAQIVFWIMGSFHVASWAKVQTTLPVVIAGAILMMVFSWRLNVMTQTEEEALSVGIDVFRWRIFYVGICTLMVAASVAAVGAIAWVGLIIPHIARYLVGPEHRKLVPAAAFLGGTFLLLMDTVARTALASEIPISIVTSIFGAPFLGYLVVNAKQIGLTHVPDR